MLHEFQIVPTEEILQLKIPESKEPFINIIEPDGYCYLYKGDLHLQGDFILETDQMENMPDGKSPIGFVIIGNLTIDGGVLNETGDYGPVLYITGNLTCRNLLIGGAPVYTGGNVHVKEVIMLHYNHGWMQCDGTFIAPVMIVDDYHLMPFRKEISLFYYNKNDPEKPGSEDKYPSIPKDLQLLLNNPLTEALEELQRDLAAGESVLQQVERSSDYWRTKVKHNWRDLKRVPLAMRTMELCMDALTGCIGALAYFPADAITMDVAIAAVQLNGQALRYLPPELITRELCYMAAEHGALLQDDIPEQFYEPELLSIVIKENDWQIERLPVAFLTEDMLVLYVKTGRGAWLDKYCQQAGVSKLQVLKRVIDDDIRYLENIFSWHLSPYTYAYAQQCYNRPAYAETWNELNERYARKIARLGTPPL